MGYNTDLGAIVTGSFSVGPISQSGSLSLAEHDPTPDSYGEYNRVPFSGFERTETGFDLNNPAHRLPNYTGGLYDNGASFGLDSPSEHTGSYERSRFRSRERGGSEFGGNSEAGGGSGGGWGGSRGPSPSSRDSRAPERRVGSYPGPSVGHSRSFDLPSRAPTPEARPSNINFSPDSNFSVPFDQLLGVPGDLVPPVTTPINPDDALISYNNVVDSVVSAYPMAARYISLDQLDPAPTGFSVSGVVGGVVGAIGHAIGGFLDGVFGGHSSDGGDHSSGGGDNGGSHSGRGARSATQVGDHGRPGGGTMGIGHDKDNGWGGHPVLLDLSGNGLSIDPLSSSQKFVDVRRRRMVSRLSSCRAVASASIFTGRSRRSAVSQMLSGR